MDPVTLIVAALVAGATSGALDSVKDAAASGIKAAYTKLRSLAGKRVAGDQGAEAALTELEADPDTWRGPLEKKLTALGAADDADLVAAAKAFMELHDADGARNGKYNVTVSNSSGVQIGDGGYQVNNF